MKKYAHAVRLMLALQITAIGGAGARPDNTKPAAITEKRAHSVKQI